MLAKLQLFNSSRSPAVAGAMLVGMLLLALVWAALVSNADIMVSAIIVASIVAIPVLVVSALNVELGLYAVTTFAYFISFIERLTGTEALPFGIMTDGYVFFLMLCVLARNRKLLRSGFWNYCKTPVIAIYLLSFAYTLLQFFNPYMFSLEGYFMGLLRFLTFLFLVFVSLYVFDSREKMFRFLKFWFFLAFIGAVYACYMEWFGLPGFESRWLFSDIRRYRLLVLFGNVRKYGFFSDPTMFGILMSLMSLFGVILIQGKLVQKKSLPLLAICIAVMLLAMGYSGTRTAYVLLPVGLFVFALFKITNIKAILFIGFLAMIFLFILYAPIYGNYTINRFRSAFNPSGDQSMQVRDINRDAIQPYIWKHPIGGGVNTAGVTGVRYNPGHTLSYYPPDNGFLRSAMETGWIGLLISAASYLSILILTVKSYFSSREHSTKVFYLALCCMFFCFFLSHFTQLVIGSFYLSFLFYPLIAIAIRYKEFEPGLYPTKTKVD